MVEHGRARVKGEREHALILGGVGGSPAVGPVYELRHDLFTQADVTSVSIPNFALPPYNATSQTRLNGVAWRPGCEGLIVGRTR